MQLDSESSTLSPLPDVLGKGLVAVSTFGLLSFFCSSSLFIYLTYRLISWRLKSGTNEPLNQFLILIHNLLFADIQQALAFLLNISALHNNGIVVGTSTCFAQGWFVSTGDLASSCFILAIALHTFFAVVKDYRPPRWAFYSGLAATWTFVYFMAAIGPILHGHDFYARASAWCWINDAYNLERLWLHYFWIFIAMFTTILIYAFIFIHLRRSPIKSTSALSATPLMILYPLIYTICTAPLAAGRIYALAGHAVSLGYFCAAGTMIACNGWLDVLLYASTRADIVFSEYPPSEDTGLETFAFMGKGHRLGTVTTIEAGSGRHGRNGSRISMGLGRRGRSAGGMDRESVENLYGLGRIGVKGEVSVVVDTIEHGLVRRDGVGTSARTEGSGSRSRDESNWDIGSRKSGKSFETR